MTKSDYRRAYETAAAELESLLKEQERIEARILSLRRTMAGLSDLLREAGDDLRWRDRLDAKIDAAMDRTITDDIRQIMNASNEPLTTSDIRVDLETLGYDFVEQKNPLATINAILNRLIEQGYVTETTKNGRKAWQRKRTAADCELSPLPQPQGPIHGEKK